MPRQSGPSRGLTHPLRTLVDKSTFEQAKACYEARKETQADFVRAAIVHFILTKCLSNPVDSTIQPEGQV